MVLSAAEAMSRLAALSVAVFLGTLAVSAGSACDHVERSNLDPAREKWSSAGEDIRKRTVDLRTRQQALAGRIGALKVPDGTEDARLTEAITQLQAQVPSLDAAVAGAERALAQGTQEVEVALSKPNKLVAQQIVDDKLAKYDEAADEAGRALDAITPQIVTAEGLMQRLLDMIAAEVRRLDNLAATGGTADFSDIDFKAGSAEFDFTHPASKATLLRLTAFAGACDQLRFGLSGHTSREGSPSANKALSLARADAVKKYLVDGGVAAAKITGTAGLGPTRPLVEEPAPGSPEEAAMPPDALADLRRKNRRVTVEVSVPCTTPVATPPAAPPPGAPGGPAAGDAIPPGAGRGEPVRVERVDPGVAPARPADPARPLVPIAAPPPPAGGVR